MWKIFCGATDACIYRTSTNAIVNEYVFIEYVTHRILLYEVYTIDGKLFIKKNYCLLR